MITSATIRINSKPNLLFEWQARAWPSPYAPRQPSAPPPASPPPAGLPCRGTSPPPPPRAPPPPIRMAPPARSVTSGGPVSCGPAAFRATPPRCAAHAPRGSESRCGGCDGEEAPFRHHPPTGRPPQSREIQRERVRGGSKANGAAKRGE